MSLLVFNNVAQASYHLLARCLVLASCIGWSTELLARKTNQSVYEEPFDLAAGGASLTRASQEGVMFANPALMPWGKKFHRWFGTQTTAIINREAKELAQSGAKDSSKILDKALDVQIHPGMLHSTSWITNNFGIGAFARVEPDIETKEFGDSGLPALHVSGEVYAGGVMSLAGTLGSWLSLGTTIKALRVSEPDLEVALTDETRIKELQSDSSTLSDEVALSSGTGFDLGSLIFLQGSSLDFRLAVKAEDLGNTKFVGNQAPFKQTLHGGMGLTFHGSTEALHLSLDYRDVSGAYEEKPFKKVYAGAKLLLRNYVGLAAGLYQGIPSAGIRADLLLLKIGFTAYGREMGTYVGERQRNLYLVYVGLGF